MCNSLMLNCLIVNWKMTLGKCSNGSSTLVISMEDGCIQTTQKNTQTSQTPNTKHPKHPKHQTYTTQFRLSVSLTEKRTTSMQQLPWSRHVKLPSYILQTPMGPMYPNSLRVGSDDKSKYICKCILTQKSRRNRTLTCVGIGMHTNRGFKDMIKLL